MIIKGYCDHNTFIQNLIPYVCHPTKYKHGGGTGKFSQPWQKNATFKQKTKREFKKGMRERLEGSFHLINPKPILQVSRERRAKKKNDLRVLTPMCSTS